MEEVDVYIVVARQKALATELEKAKINFGKDSPSRKTKKYIDDRLQKIDEIWEEFLANHNKIRHVVKPDTPYMQKDTLNVVKSIYEKLKSDLESTTPADGKSNVEPSATQMGNEIQTQRLKKLQIKIGAIMRSIDAFEQTFTKYSKEVHEYQQKILLEQWRNLTELHEEFLSNATTEDFKNSYLVESKYEGVEEDINNCLFQMASKSAEIEKPMVNTSTEVRLPSLKIPTFKGNYLEWKSFCDIFTTIIHNKESLGVTEKMEYLKTHLEGEPLQLIQHFTISSENYSSAWETLKKRYDNERKIVSIHLDRMLKPNHSGNQPSANHIKTILDANKEGLAALKNMGFETTSWGPLIVHLVVKNLDHETRNLFEQSIQNPNKMPTQEELFEFLARRYQALEVLGSSKQRILKEEPKNFIRNYHVATVSKCVICKGDHYIHSCNKFISWTPKVRLEEVKAAKLCINCLRHDKQSVCQSKRLCKHCNKKHNSLLHIEKFERRQPEQGAITQSQVNHGYQGQNILLATAIIIARNKSGYTRQIRALIDPGSQATMVTEEVAQSLRLHKEKVFVPVSGLGATEAGVVRSRVSFTILPRMKSDFKTEVQALVLPKLTKLLPSENMTHLQTKGFEDITLADPEYNAPGVIDMILGADIYGEIILDGVKKGPHNASIAQRSQLGWLITGRTLCKKNCSFNITGMIVQTTLEKQLQKFWDIEEVPENANKTQDEIDCENIFQYTQYRDKDGRYVVCLPFNKHLEQTHELGESRQRAIARFRQLEAKLNTNNDLKMEYRKFLKEFSDLGHMVKVEKNDEPKLKTYYMPHHAVLKPDSTTTKLRVVFDASAKTSSGVSLNQLLLVGPKIQEDLTVIVMRWRRHKFVFTADIEKMYRQIKVREDHQDYQRIIWRDNANSPIKEFKLTTVTYGTAPAPYLAIRTLQQLAEDEKQQYPIASQILKKDFYVDDTMSGEDTVTGCQEAQTQLKNILKTAGFNLHKWASNNANILKNVEPDAKHQQDVSLDKDETIKTLGIHWNPTSDTFHFKVHIKLEPQSIIVSTKRSTLSEIAKLYDPLGWLAPITVVAKLLMQQLWRSQLDWDEPLTPELQHQWKRFRCELGLIESIKIARWMGGTKSQKIELHGFCDASEVAYAAVIYSRIQLPDGKFNTTLLMAKTKVAPIKKKVTLPKLELCGAYLLSKLLKEVKRTFGPQVGQVFAWTDSTITLAWIRGCPSTWKTFVANRVSQIQEVTTPNEWKHIKSADNPADCASRGVTPGLLKNHSLWWTGPLWLQQDESDWPTDVIVGSNVPESRVAAKDPDTVKETAREMIVPKPKIALTATIEESKESNPFDRFSSYTSLIIAAAKCRRFIYNCKNRSTKKGGSLMRIELEEAKKGIIRNIQEKTFAEELACLQKGRNLHKKSKILSLNPRVNNEGMLVVGGRLDNANLPELQRHPYILPRNDNFTKLLVDYAHKITLHGGIKLTMAKLRQSYWILQAKSVVRQIIHNCVRCHRFNASTKEQIMGILPSPRVTPSRPFTYTGIDYAGPIQILISKGRGHRSTKGYISIFICLATKAIHIELVSDLTSEAFLAALKRFSSRRGIPSHIYSDCGTTFVGADKEMQKLLKQATNQFEKNASEKLLLQNVEWHFIPPAAPHFGGLWEAGVKSMKYHLKRIIGDTHLTFEELATLLTQIEACLNSRPLTAISNDIEDNTILTPGHFLVGAPLNATPEPIIENSKSIRSRWLLTQKMVQDFWKIWSTEYLSQLQQRSKWKLKQSNLQNGDIVLVKDERLPPTKWCLGKIEEVHPGKDNEVRAATVLSNNKYIKRPITKLSPLPIEAHAENDQNHREQSNLPKIQSHISRTMCSRPTSTGNRITKFNPFLLLCVISLFTTPKASGQNFEVTPFKSQPGIFFEDIGKANMVVSSWKTIVFFNLSNYWAEVNTYKKCIRHMTDICLKTNLTDANAMLCSSTLQLFNRQLQQIELNNDVLLHTNNETPTRFKRSPFDFVGTVTNELFGILDQRFANRYEETINKISSNEDHLIDLLKNQTSIVNSTVNLFKEGRVSTQNQLKLLTKMINKLESEMNDEHAFQMFISTAFPAMLTMINFYNTQNVLLNIILATHHGQIHPLILNVKQLKAELTRIHDNIPRSMMIPGEGNHESIIQLYRTLQPRARVTGKNVIIEITLPLLYNEEFKMYKLLSVPTWQEQNFTYIVPSSDYLIVNLQGDHFYPLNEVAFSLCKQRSSAIFWCDMKYPIYTAESKVSSCEMSFLRHNREIPASCVIQIVPPQVYWVQMHHPNTWIFSTPSEINVDISCGSSIMAAYLKDSGILKVSPTC